MGFFPYFHPFYRLNTNMNISTNSVKYQPKIGKGIKENVVLAVWPTEIVGAHVYVIMSCTCLKCMFVCVHKRQWKWWTVHVQMPKNERMPVFIHARLCMCVCVCIWPGLNQRAAAIQQIRASLALFHCHTVFQSKTSGLSSVHSQYLHL